MQLRVKITGAKSWLFGYFKPITKKRSSMGFGTYSEVTLVQARGKRDKDKALLAQGIDPREEKDDQLREEQLAEGILSKVLLLNGSLQSLLKVVNVLLF